MIFENPKFYQTVFNTLNIGINIVDTKGKILYVNKSYCKMHNYAENELIGQSIALILPDNDKMAGLKNFKKIVNKKIKKSFVVKSFNRRKNNTLFPVILAWNYLFRDKQ